MSERSRRGEVEPAADALARLLREHDLPVPEVLPDMLAVPGHHVHDASIEAQPQRHDRLLELGWPRRALAFARRPERSRALDATEAWSRSKRSSLVLAGKKGTGKTVAAAWHALHDRRVFRFARSATLVRTGRFDEQMAEWMRAPALCIDDLGAEYSDVKGSFLADLDELIDTFYSDMRPLIITTNLDGAGFANRYGSRILDRLQESSDWIPLDSESMRAQPRDVPDDDTPPWERDR